MKFYWRYRDIPELATLSPDDRKTIVRYCTFRSRFDFRRPLWWAAFLARLVFGLAGIIVGDFLAYDLGYSEFVQLSFWFVGIIIGVFVSWPLWLQLLRLHCREYLATKTLSSNGLERFAAPR
jgi:hypothetical protein